MTGLTNVAKDVYKASQEAKNAIETVYLFRGTVKSCKYEGMGTSIKTCWH